MVYLPLIRVAHWEENLKYSSPDSVEKKKKVVGFIESLLSPASVCGDITSRVSNLLLFCAFR